MSDEHTASAVLVAFDMASQTASSDAPELAQRILAAAAALTEGGIIEVDGEPSDADVDAIVAILDPLATMVALDGPQAVPVEGDELGFAARLLGALRPVIARVWPLARGLVQRFGRRLIPMMRQGFPRMVRGVRGVWRTLAGKWTLIAGGVLLGARWIGRQLRELGQGAGELAFGLGKLGLILVLAYLAFQGDGGGD